MGEHETRYKIIEGRSREELEVNVRIAMLSDWEPQGGVAVDSDTYTFYQAMVPKGD